MTAGLSSNHFAFKRALIFSVILHGLVFAAIIASPVLPSFSKKGMVHYVNVYSLPGGGGSGGGSGGGPGGGGGSGAELQTTPLPAKKESLRDLTVPRKAKAETPASMRYPVEKPKKEPKSKAEKKAVISKPQAAASQAAQAQEGRPGAGPGTGIGTGTGSGSGLRIGVGDGPGGDGFGFGYGTGGGSGFPYNYYLQVIMDRVSVNWFTGLVDPGVAGSFQAVVYFKIHRNGQVSELKVETSSGLQSLDLSALRAVQNSAPFPPLPNDYDDQYLVIHLIFEHSK